MSIRGVIILAVLILFTLFILQNIESATVSFLFWYAEMPLALLLAFTLSIGIFIGLMIPRNKA